MRDRVNGIRQRLDTNCSISWPQDCRKERDVAALAIERLQERFEKLCHRVFANLRGHDPDLQPSPGPGATNKLPVTSLIARALIESEVFPLPRQLNFACGRDVANRGVDV